MTDVLPDCRVIIQGVVFLREISEFETVPRFQLAGIGGLHARQQPQQRRLASAVEPQDHDPGTTIDGQIHSGEDLQRPVVLGQPLGHQRHPPTRGRRGKLDAGHLVGHPFFVEPRQHLLSAAQHILRGNGFGGLSAHLGRLGAQG
ncbi:Uncharacterised protein [Mycobacteroides abscessus subsp. abscessus]|nr:Uncharacterised protein [Mycobacteroides abscessus subsp. abscessus]